MTELEKFQQLFDSCSIFLGGSSTPEPQQDGSINLNIDIAFSDPKTGMHQGYEVFRLVFDQDGNWKRTFKVGKGKSHPR